MNRDAVEIALHTILGPIQARRPDKDVEEDCDYYYACLTLFFIRVQAVGAWVRTMNGQ